MTLRYSLAVLICSILITSYSVSSRTHPHSEAAPGAPSGTWVLGERLPTISNISPASGAPGQTLSIVCTGTNFIRSVTTVNFGNGVVVSSLSVQSATKLTAQITISESAKAGALNVTVTNNVVGGGTTRLSNAFFITHPPPEISQVSPSTVERGQTLTLSLTGKNFLGDELKADFGPGVTINSISAISETQLKVEISVSLDAATGSRAVAVGDASALERKTTLPEALAVVNPIPVVTSISPVLIKKGQAADILISGANFLEDVTSVNLGTGIKVNSMEVISPTQIVLNVNVTPDALVGSREVRVVNSGPGGGAATIADEFVIGNPAPSIESISPPEGKRGQTLEIVVNGADFLQGVSDLDLGENTVVNAVVFSGSNRMVASVTITPEAASGAREVSVSNRAPGGGIATLSKSFVVLNPTPSAASISPSKAMRGFAATIVLTGANFFPDVTSVSFGPDVTVNSLSFRDGTEITANVSVSAAAIPGSRSVIITNAAPGGGKVMLTNALTVTAPFQGVGENESGSMPKDYVLQEAYPNPFNPSTTIRFGLPEQSYVKLEIHNLIGKAVAELIDGTRAQGYYEIPWTPSNLPSGVYLVRIHATSMDGKHTFVSSRKVVLLK